MPAFSPDSSADGKVNAAASLYKDCLAYFTTLSLSQSDYISSDQKERKFFKRELGRLFLWGEDFQDGKLQIILRHSTDLINTVLRLLVALGRALVKTYNRSDSAIDHRLDSMTRQLKFSFDAIRHLTQGDLDSCLEDDGRDDDDDDDNNDDAAPDDTDEESDDGISFYLNLLMNLSPSMEQVYSQAMKDKEDQEDQEDSMSMDAGDKPTFRPSRLHGPLSSPRGYEYGSYSAEWSESFDVEDYLQK